MYGICLDNSNLNSRNFRHIWLSGVFLETKKVWKCENELDFLYGYYVGKIEEATLHYLLKATRASAGDYVDNI